MKWNDITIKPNNGDVIIVFMFGQTVKENDYYVGVYNYETDEVEFKDYIPADLSSFDLWAKVEIPQMPVC